MTRRLMTLSAVIAVGSIAACTRTEGVVKVSGILVVTPSSLDFGVWPVGASVSQTVELKNVGVVPLMLGPAQFDGAGVSCLTEGRVIDRGGSIAVDVTFSPTVAGPHASTISFFSSNGESFEVTVKVVGSGTALQPCGACDAAPAVHCVSSEVSVSYDAVGSCVERVCVYPEHLVPCAFGCDASTGRCRDAGPDAGPIGGGGGGSGGGGGGGGSGGGVAGPWEQAAYLKASNTNTADRFGTSVAVSGDGNIVAVGAVDEDSHALGVGGNQIDNSLSGAGAVYVFARASGSWVQEAYLKASDPQSEALFGAALALNSEGTTLAVGATGADGMSRGAIYIYTRSAGSWAFQARLTPNTRDIGDGAALALSLSADGNRLAVGLAHEQSAAQGINGNQADNSAPLAGAVVMFERSGSNWVQSAYLKGSNTESHDNFGAAVALSDDGLRLVVGAPGESSASTTIGGDQISNAAPASGAVYVFAFSGTWTQEAYVKAFNAEAFDHFGTEVALSGDGLTVVVGAPHEDSEVMRNSALDNSSADSGAVYVFQRTAGAWSQTGYLKAPSGTTRDYFGSHLGVSTNGQTIAIGAPGDDSGATGIGGSQTDNAVEDCGAVHVFEFSGGIWAQHTYLKASNARSRDGFSNSLSLSGTGRVLTVGSLLEASSAVGINGSQNNTLAPLSGAAYLFER